MSEPHQMLTPKDIALILGVHQKTVHLWLRNGRLKGIKISYRAWRVPRSALDEFIEQNSNVVTPKGVVGKTAEMKEDTTRGQGKEPSAVIQDTQQAKMKQYLQDIMAEQPPKIGKSS